MIKIVVKVDSIENRKDAVIYGCDWEIVSEMTENEEYSAKIIIKHIQDAFDDLAANALVNGGSVERIYEKDKDEKK
jgi:hypothetical protein